MKRTITDFQKRRADNIVWTCAKDYSFVPDFKAYDSNGDADVYWNETTIPAEAAVFESISRYSGHIRSYVHCRDISAIIKDREIAGSHSRAVGGVEIDRGQTAATGESWATNAGYRGGDGDGGQAATV